MLDSASGETPREAGAAIDPAAMRWRGCAFDALSVYELQAIYAARQQVFAIEQDCVYLDVDGADDRSLHLAAWCAGRALPFAYARVVAPGVKYPEPSIGRVLTTAAARGTGLGRELVRRAVELARSEYGACAIRISAQAHLDSFYGGFGFVSVGEPYLEDGIAHLEMLLAPD